MNPGHVKVHIPKPCNENWEAMLPVDQGRFCLNCRKTVIDFTQKSDAEILAFFAQKDTVCGRFANHQVLSRHELPRTFFQRWKDYVAAASLIIGTKLVTLTPALAQTASVTPKTVTPFDASQHEEPLFDENGNLHLKGKVLDALKKQPLAGVQISLQQASQSYQTTSNADGSVIYNEHRSFTTVSDSTGNFELIVPAVDLGPFSYILLFKKNDYFGGGIPLEDLPNKMRLVQYLSKNEHPVRDSYYASKTTMGVFPNEQIVVEKYFGSRKAYRTRAGVVIARVLSPYYKLKSLIHARFFYS